MGRPAKPVDLIVSEGKSHRTKSELNQRKAAENATTSGKKMNMRQEVKNNPLAKKEFNRLRTLLRNIGKDDALQEGVINRYALLCAEVVEFENLLQEFTENRQQLTQEYRNALACETTQNNGGLTPSEYYKLLNSIQKNIVAIDKQIMAKRAMLLSIEKENLLTIAGCLRAIPKKQEKKAPASGAGSYFANRKIT